MTDDLRVLVDRLLGTLRDAADARTSRERVGELLRGADNAATGVCAALPPGPDQADVADRLVAAAVLLDHLGATPTATRLLTAARGSAESNGDGDSNGDGAAAEGGVAERIGNAIAAVKARHDDWTEAGAAVPGGDGVAAVNTALISVYGMLGESVQSLPEPDPGRPAAQEFALRAAAFDRTLLSRSVPDSRAALAELDRSTADLLAEVGEDDPYLDLALLVVASARCALFAVTAEVDALREAADALGVAVQRYSVALGPTHPCTLGGQANLAYAEFELALAAGSPDDVARTVDALRQVRDAAFEALGRDHRLSARLAMNAAGGALELSRVRGSVEAMVAAAEELRQAAELASWNYGALHPIAAIAVANVAIADEDLAAARRAAAADDLLAAVEASLKRFTEGEFVDAVVLRIDPDQVVLEIDDQTEALLPKAELSLRTVEPADVLTVGERIEVVVVRRTDESGRLVVSRKRAQSRRAWAVVEAAQTSKESVRGTVIEVVKGGLIVDIGLRAFLPASLVDTRRVRDLQPYLGRDLDALVIEFDKKRNNVVLSRRAWLEATRTSRRSTILDQLTKGQVRTGVVSSIVDFGAFVDLGGIDGLVHLSELSWQHVDHLSEVVQVGQRVMVEVREVDASRERVSLSMKAAQEDPWRQFARAHAIGQYLPGTITKIRQFGAFMRVADGIEGLIHISELTDYRVEKPEDVIRTGDELIVRVVDIDLERRRVSLSLRQANAVPPGTDFDPTEYGMAAEYDADGQFIFPEGFDADTNDWLPGYETQRDEWERQYRQAESWYEMHMRQVGGEPPADGDAEAAEGDYEAEPATEAISEEA